MLELLGVFLAVLAVFATLSRLLPGVWSFVKGFARLVGTIEEIAREFKPNGGTSLRDQINQIQRRLDNIESRLE